MKCIRLILICVVFALSGSAQSLESVWGVPMGVSRDSARKLIEQKHGYKPSGGGADGQLVYKHCKFGEYEAALIRLRFCEDKLYGGDVYIEPRVQLKIAEEYKELIEELSVKYGRPLFSVESYDHPFRKGDGKELDAIRGGHATIGDQWYLPAGSDEASAKSRIMAGVDERMSLHIYYYEVASFNIMLEKEKKRISDY